ncbi:MAG: putative conserved protein YndB, domain [Bacteroidetes bacterium]|nr:putative conserved protein YndB, domain [Bacteroidota bacterium]
MQELGTAGALAITFIEKDLKTEVTMTYAAGGYMKQGLDSIGGIVDDVLSLQLNRFRSYADKK